MDKILFVCSGNTCRSPFAEKYFNKLARELNVSALASSAGLFASENANACENAQSAAKDFGVDSEMKTHRAVQLTANMLNEYDYIIAMGASHLDIIEKAVENSVSVKSTQKRLVLGGGISDPFGGSLSGYKNCYSQIADEINAFIEANYR